MEARAPVSSLEPLFHPRSIAVVGASRKRGAIGAEILHNLIKNEFSGAVYPVNPTATSVQSIRAYPTVAAIPDPVDLAVIVVPKRHVVAAIEDCAAKGVRGLIVISAGFGETGEEGRATQARMVELVRKNGMRMVGPNCLGLLSTDPECRVNATFAPTWPPQGSVAFSSQSGALGLAILDYAQDLGIGVSQFVSVGNKADVSGNDLIEYWEHDPRTKIILLYLESFGNPRRFLEIASRVTKKKPIVAVKSGRSQAGARAAASHTGSLAGADTAVDALLHQAGVLRTDTIEELFDVAMVLDSQPVPRGKRVAILTNAGGPGIMASDACEARGLEVTPLAPATEKALREFLPAEASVRNPVDMIASAPPTSFEKSLKLLLADPNVDAVIVLFVPPIVTEASDVADAIRRGAAGTEKTIVTCFMGTHGVPEALSTLREGKFPSYAFPEAAAIALSRAIEYSKLRDRATGKIATFDVDRLTVQRVHETVCRTAATGPAWLAPEDVRALLGAYGFRLPREQLAKTRDQVAIAAREVGFPQAVKLVSSTISHKSDVGGVVLNVESAADAQAAYDDIGARLATVGQTKALEGVVLQEMVPRGVECFVGMKRDGSFGPLLAFGIGGTSVELWRDVVFRVAPVTDVDAIEMLDGIRGVKLLQGFRGAPPADRAALMEALQRASQLVDENPWILELDINPLVALPPGNGAVAVDARVRVQAQTPPR